MAEFRTVTPQELAENPFRLIGKDWMLVTSANDGAGFRGGEDYNTMTASWGGVGILWNKPVAFVFIRPQRHTFKFTEKNKRLTLSFFGEDYRPALSYCGKFSGLEKDKAADCGLTPVSDTDADGRAVWFDEARIVMKTRKLYESYLDETAFLEPELLENYKSKDFHKMYICEIEQVLVKD